MKLTLISDTHTKHNNIISSKSSRKKDGLLDLPGGDILIHAGDFMSSGYSQREAEEFFEWFNNLDDYDHKIFIAGNHDRIMQLKPELMTGLLTGYKHIDYLEDDWVHIGEDEDNIVSIYGTPWQPEFHQWAYNLPRNGDELKSKWDAIPETTDILITHGPAWGMLDDVENRRGIHLGCELLTERIKTIRPKIHVCGHIHSGYGHYFDGHTHFFNASVLDETYYYSQLPWNIDWNPITNEIEFLR
jgi:Icc-related predicted phosphoesterase